MVAAWLAPTEFDRESPGLGNNTTRIRDAQVAGVPIRDNGRPALEALDSLPKREDGVQSIVWLGNSHQHAVNSLQPGDTVSSVYLHRSLNGEMYPGRAPVIGISYPSLRYEEQFLLTLALSLRDPAGDRLSLDEHRRSRAGVKGVDPENHSHCVDFSSRGIQQAFVSSTRSRRTHA